jgi:hypothetical protein
LVLNELNLQSLILCELEPDFESELGAFGFESTTLWYVSRMVWRIRCELSEDDFDGLLLLLLLETAA